jgi:hypothetical protein
MKCRVDIEKGIVKRAMEEFETKNIKRVSQNQLFIANNAFPSGAKQAYNIALSTVNRANKLFQGQVAFRSEYDYGQAVTFQPSQGVVTRYYNEYLQSYEESRRDMEETIAEDERNQDAMNARMQAREDAARSGVLYTDDYLFENTDMSSSEVQEDIFINMNNLYFTPSVLEYLYGESSGKMDFNNFARAAKTLAANLRGMNFPAAEILDKIKCM